MLRWRAGGSRPISFAFLSGLVLVAAGCGVRKYPVEGKVVWADGSAARELAGGMVVFECTEVPRGARGEIKEDGSFRLVTEGADDGVMPGHYRVLVAQHRPEPEGRTRPPPPPMDPRFEDFTTSKLVYTVEPGKNEVVLQVERDTRKGRR